MSLAGLWIKQNIQKKLTKPYLAELNIFCLILFWTFSISFSTAKTQNSTSTTYRKGSLTRLVVWGFSSWTVSSKAEASWQESAAKYLILGGWETQQGDSSREEQAEDQGLFSWPTQTHLGACSSNLLCIFKFNELNISGLMVTLSYTLSWEFS